MNGRTEEILYAAYLAVSDDCVFSEDQVKALQDVVRLIASAISQEGDGIPIGDRWWKYGGNE